MNLANCKYEDLVYAQTSQIFAYTGQSTVQVRCEKTGREVVRAASGTFWNALWIQYNE